MMQLIRRGVASLLLLAAAVASARGQIAANTVESHVAAAKAAASTDHVALFETLCTPPAPRPAASAANATPPTPRPATPPGPPDPSRWAADPVKVFDNLLFVGEKEYSAWAVTTSGGIIILDTIFEYSVDRQIAGGLTALGKDPKTIKYAIVQPRTSRSLGWRAVFARSLQCARHFIARRLGHAGEEHARSGKAAPRH
jgi:metallo-beta-lactamase class B